MPTVQILVGGVDVTADVVFATAHFQQLVNGKSGESYMRVRDLDSTYSFTEGTDWLVKVDGEAAWRGFTTMVVRTYIAPALDVAEWGLQRFIDLRGSDINLLFARRIVAKASNPAAVTGTQFPAGTADTVAITELLDNWLDLSTDDLDTTTGVVHVGDLDPEQPSQAWSGGWTWGDAMTTIAMLPAAIYYLRPETGSPKATLCYADVDEATAPFGLSDVPNGTTTKGYREMEISKDGTNLANDVLGWGMGYGSNVPVFKREVDDDSVAEHGVWQQATVRTGIYKQGSINRVVDSIINGSPESHRGAKDDRPYIKLTTYDPGLLAGQVVDFESQVWGYTDAIPVRQLDLLFEGPDIPRYELILSHEIDAPWGFIDPFWPNFTLPPGFGVPPRYPPPPGGGQTTTTCQCGITDSFNRTIAANNTDIGPSDAGPVWVVNDGGVGATLEVTPDTGLIFLVPAAETFGIEAELPNLVIPGPEFNAIFRVMFTDFVPGESSRFDINYVAFMRIEPGLTSSTITISVGVDTIHADLTVEEDVWYNIQIASEDSKTTLDVGIWKDGEAPNTTPVLTGIDMTGAVVDRYSIEAQNQGSPGNFRVQFDQLDISNYDTCGAAQFDNFGRTVDPNGWGISTPSGHVWTRGSSSNGLSNVGAGYGILQNGTSATTEQEDVSTGLSPTADFGATVQLSVSSDDDVIDSSFIFAGLAFGWHHNTAGAHPYLFVDDNLGGRATLDFTDGFWSGIASVAVMKAERRGGFARIKLWDIADPEPDWWLEAPISTGGYTLETATFASRGSVSVGTQNTFVKSIDFDYAGKPCYYNCNCGITDAFGRTVAEVTHLSTSGTTLAPIGDSDAGVTWTGLNLGGGPFNLSGGGVGAAMDGSSLVIRGIWDAGTNLPGGDANYLLPVTVPQDHSAIKKFNFTLDSIPLNVSGFTVPIPGGSPSGSKAARVHADPTGVGVLASYIGFTGTLSDSTSISSAFWVAGKTYFITLIDDGVSTTITITDGVTTYSRTSTGYTGDDIENPGIGVSWDTLGGVSLDDSVTIHINDLDIPEITNCTLGTAECDPVGSTEGTVVNGTNVGNPTVPQSPSSYGCERPQRLTSVVSRTSRRYTALSTFVWRDGLLQNRGVDYLENSDHRTLTFSDPAPASVEVFVCYFGEVTLT